MAIQLHLISARLPVKVKDGDYETRRIAYLSSQMRQSIISRTLDNLRGLAHLRATGRKVGKMRFKSEVKSIPLKQFGNTYMIVDAKHVRIQGIKQKLRVRGLEQLPRNVDLANANLIHRNGDHYLSIITYQARETKNEKTRCAGIDLGLDKQLVISDGIAIQYSIPICSKLGRLHRRLSRQKPHIGNWNKTRVKLNREYSKSCSIKKDIRNKIVSHLKSIYEVVCYQDESISAWQRIWGTRILQTSIGGIMSTLKQKVHTPVEVGRFYPSTKTCSACGNIQEIGLGERAYICHKCGTVIDRDLNASVNIRNEGLRRIGMVHTESTPAEIRASTLASLEYLNSIPYVEASSIHEPGSPLALEVDSSPKT